MRVVTERVRGVRSVAIGFWIGAGSRDERSAKAGASHFIEHLLFKGSRNYTAHEIASIFDRLGGELNAATSRENTVVYARVPDDRLELAINVITDMVYTPLFADLDAERAVVLEEIAMYEDTPQEYVHDLISEAVFGRHPLGRPVVGEAAVIESISRRSLASYHQAMYAPGNVVVAAVGNLEHDRLLSLLERRGRQGRGGAAPADPLAARARARAGAALPAEADGAVPRVPRRARDRPFRPAALRRLAARRHPRRLGLVATVPGDPREARDGVLGLHVRVAVHGHGPGRALRRDAGGQPARVPRHRRRADPRHRLGEPDLRASSSARRTT